MLNPNSLKAKPADNYDDLKKQFFALKNLCESKIKQCSIYSNKLAEYDRESILARSEALESEKEMNAQLTEELAKANERVKELEKGNKSCAVAIREIIAKGDIGPLLVTGPELDEIVNKFAIEKKIEALESTLRENSRPIAYPHGHNTDVVYSEDIKFDIEQLHKEQE